MLGAHFDGLVQLSNAFKRSLRDPWFHYHLAWTVPCQMSLINASKWKISLNQINYLSIRRFSSSLLIAPTCTVVCVPEDTMELLRLLRCSSFTRSGSSHMPSFMTDHCTLVALLQLSFWFWWWDLHNPPAIFLVLMLRLTQPASYLFGSDAEAYITRHCSVFFNLPALRGPTQCVDAHLFRRTQCSIIEQWSSGSRHQSVSSITNHQSEWFRSVVYSTAITVFSLVNFSWCSMYHYAWLTPCRMCCVSSHFYSFARGFFLYDSVFW